MLKVLAVCDKEGTALDRLAQGLKPFNTNLDYQVIAVHPKKADPEQLKAFEEAAKNADIIDYYYFRTALMLEEKYPWLKEKKRILEHHNPYSIFEQNWDGFDKVFANNHTIKKELEKLMHNPAKRLHLVPLAVDTDFWTFNQEWTPNDNVIMVANRIEGKKGVLPVAIACGELGLTLHLVGAISDRNYFDAVMSTGAVIFHEGISDEELRSLYHRSTIHVCNSVDNFESGTLPILEAMLTGVPVLTRKVGHVPDLYDEQNMVIHDGDNEDVIGIKQKLFSMINDKEKLKDLRERGWGTAKGRGNERRAYHIQRIYRQLQNEQKPVSVIVPIFDKPEIIRQCLDAISEQDYGNIELVVCDDNPESENQQMVAEFAKFVSFPVRYIHTASTQNDYGLARARNLGAIEATGDVLVFCDQRQIMDKGAISSLVASLTEKKWVYGNKGTKKEFVENFSAVHRQEFIFAGMFNERCNQYGALSQELRGRFTAQGFKFEFIEEAKATPVGKSSNRWQKKAEIIKSKNMLYKMSIT